MSDIMPSKSPAQAQLMRAAAHSSTFAKKVGVPQSVGRDFVQADKEKAMKDTPKMMKKEMAFMKAKGAPKSMVKHEMAEAKGEKTKKYAKGGMVDGVAKRGHTRGKMC